MQRSLRTRAVESGLARVEPADNVLVAYAAKDGTTAADGYGAAQPVHRRPAQAHRDPGPRSDVPVPPGPRRRDGGHTARAAAVRLRVAVEAGDLSVGRVPGSAVHPAVERPSRHLAEGARGTGAALCLQRRAQGDGDAPAGDLDVALQPPRFGRRGDGADGGSVPGQFRRPLRPRRAERDAAAAADRRQLRAPRHAAGAVRRRVRPEVDTDRSGRTRASAAMSLPMRRRRGRRPPRCIRWDACISSPRRRRQRDAEEAALAACRKAAAGRNEGGTCFLYAIGNRVVLPGRHTAARSDAGKSAAK